MSIHNISCPLACSPAVVKANTSMTHVHLQVLIVEHHRRVWGAPWRVAVDFVRSLVPLDRVEMVTPQLPLALQWSPASRRHPLGATHSRHTDAEPS